MKNLLIITTLFYLVGCGKGNFIKTEYKDWGEVIGIYNCIRGKSYLDCEVITTQYRFSRIDITDFPTQYLTKGDKLSLKLDYYENSIRESYCVNGYCNPYSICYSWMPCHNNYEK